MRSGWLLAAGLVVAVPAGVAAQAEILGRWHGTSTCVKESWNASCNDERIVYDFVPSAAGAPGVLLHAYKVVGSDTVSMGDLELLPDSGAGRWAGEFSNSRVHIRWMYQVRDSSLTGTLGVYPELRVARHVVARR